MGISNDRITTHGYGEESPVASNSTAAGRQMNRRVEIILSDDNGNVSSR
jgi:outer membrane protein OmpA-like peptidoglycan-associated protein